MKAWEVPQALFQRVSEQFCFEQEHTLQYDGGQYTGRELKEVIVGFPGAVVFRNEKGPLGYGPAACFMLLSRIPKGNVSRYDLEPLLHVWGGLRMTDEYRSRLGYRLEEDVIISFPRNIILSKGMRSIPVITFALAEVAPLVVQCRFEKHWQEHYKQRGDHTE